MSVPVCISTRSVRGFPFLHTPSAFIVCRLFDGVHSDWHEMIPVCGFDLHFSNNQWYWVSFHVFISYLYIFFGEGNGTPLQYSCLENPMDSGAWWATVHGVTKSWTQLSDFTFTFHFPALEKEIHREVFSKSHLSNMSPVVVERGSLEVTGHTFPFYDSKVFLETEDTKPNIIAKDVPISLIIKILRILGAVSQELWMKTKCIFLINHNTGGT